MKDEDSSCTTFVIGRAHCHIYNSKNRLGKRRHKYAPWQLFNYLQRSLDWHRQCSPRPVQTWSLWRHPDGRASLHPSVPLGSCRRKRLLQHLHPSCRTEGLRPQCLATWARVTHRLWKACGLYLFVGTSPSLRLKVFPTCHRPGQPQPHRSRRRRPVLARKRCALPGVWSRCRSLSLTEPQLHCDWLWVPRPPPSGPNCWWCCVPSPGRILGSHSTVMCHWHQTGVAAI